MNMLNTKNWQKVRINVKNKLVTFTNNTTFKTKAECDTTVKSNQYISVNLKALNKLLADGYTIHQPIIENAVQIEKSNTKAIVDLTGNPEVEEAIRQYYVAKKSKEEAKAKAIADFLTPVSQPKFKPLDLSKQIEKFEKTGRARALKALENQRQDYCNM